MYLLFNTAIATGTVVVLALIAVMLHRQSAQIIAILVGSNPVSAKIPGAAKPETVWPAFA